MTNKQKDEVTCNLYTTSSVFLNVEVIHKTKQHYYIDRLLLNFPFNWAAMNASNISQDTVNNINTIYSFDISCTTLCCSYR